MQLVVGCGDAEGKAQATFSLVQRGVNVWFPGDRYQDLLLGYEGTGVVLGTAPVKKVGGKAVLGHQPVRFSLSEPIVVEDTKQIFPIQYYDSAARYFRRLSSVVPLKLEYVNVDAADQIERVIARARQLRSSAIAVRVATKAEDAALRRWLAKARWLCRRRNVGPRTGSTSCANTPRRNSISTRRSSIWPSSPSTWSAPLK